jgi:predicted nucleic acid-binding protein
MTAPVVCDASAVVALLVDSGPDGRWVTATVREATLAAPDLLPFEVANVLRRLERSGLISSDTAAQAHLDMLDLAVEMWPYAAVAPRAWQLRANLTSCDASYVAVAEAAGAVLVTLDRALVRATGITCRIAAPDGRG